MGVEPRTTSNNKQHQATPTNTKQQPQQPQQQVQQQPQQQPQQQVALWTVALPGVVILSS